MSGDVTPKIEPTVTVADAPPIAPEAAKAEAAEPAAPKIEAIQPEAPKSDVSNIETKAAPEEIEPKVEPTAEPKIEPKIEAPTLPPAPQIAESAAIVRLKRREPRPEVIASRPRSSRFALLAACVAIAASFGAIGGSLGVAKFGPMLAAAPSLPAPIVASAQRDNTAEELKALKETVTQLRTATRALSENLATLKVSVSTSNVTQNAQNAQIGKIAETIDRVEKAQAEQRKIATAAAAQAQAAPETTGSITQQKSGPTVPMVLGDPPTTLKPPILQDYVLRRVYDGAALIEGRHGIIEVEPGIVAPGLGRIEAIKRQDGRWVVVTARGLVVQR